MEHETTGGDDVQPETTYLEYSPLGVDLDDVWMASVAAKVAELDHEGVVKTYMHTPFRHEEDGGYSTVDMIGFIDSSTGLTLHVFNDDVEDVEWVQGTLWESVVMLVLHEMQMYFHDVLVERWGMALAEAHDDGIFMEPDDEDEEEVQEYVKSYWADQGWD